MNLPAVVAVVLSALLGAGCASAPAVPTAPPTALLADDLFPPPARPLPDAAAVLAPSDAMRRFVTEQLAEATRRVGARQALIDVVRDPRWLQLRYDTERTRTAAEAFDARAGHCLSLVVMTASLARTMGVPVTFQAVATPATWTRQGDLLLVAGHVNLRLGGTMADWRTSSRIPDSWLVDFLPPEQLVGARTRTITEATVVAMFMNNRAAEALADGDPRMAYHWARQAVQADPQFLAGWNTLAVVYQRSGLPDRAERALRWVLDREPGNLQALANLSAWLRDRDPAEAARLATRLAELQPEPPFFHYDQGADALRRGEFTVARDAFLRELDRTAGLPEAHFGLALAYLGLRQPDRARRHLTLAREHSATLGERAMYSAKLDALAATTRRQ